VIPESVAKVSIMTQAPGAFFCFGLLMAGCVWLEGKLDARIERKSCCDLDNLKKEAE
jgi:electron transport complex protein RnfE